MQYTVLLSISSLFSTIINSNYFPTPYPAPPLGKVSELLRLLLVYHFPALALHLDRTVPGWELLADTTSASEAGT